MERKQTRHNRAQHMGKTQTPHHQKLIVILRPRVCRPPDVTNIPSIKYKRLLRFEPFLTFFIFSSPIIILCLLTQEFEYHFPQKLCTTNAYSTFFPKDPDSAQTAPCKGTHLHNKILLLCLGTKPASNTSYSRVSYHS